MAVDYDRSRTQVLTTADMIASLSEMYRPRSPRPARPARRLGYDALDTPSVIAQWRQGETVVALQHSSYTSSFSLVITSVTLEALARKAQAAAVTMGAREAREAARAKEQADAAKTAAEKTRTTNKATFQP